MTDDARARALIARVGRTATAFQALGRGVSHWFAPAPTDGLVAFVPVRGAWVAAGEPIAKPDQALMVAEAFVAAAGRAGVRASFFATEGNLAASPRFRRLLLGEQPVWHPPQWEAYVRGHRSFREQLRRARAKGVSVAVYDAASLCDPGLREPLDRLVARWLAARSMAPLAFLVDMQPFAHAEEKHTLLALRNGEPCGLLSLAPVSARNGWLFEHLLRDGDAPNGTAELLVDAAMRLIADEGAQWATLGLAPLSGALNGPLRAVRRLSRPLFNFDGLAAFKRKLRPERWEPIYLAYPREHGAFIVVIDGLRAFAGGSMWRFVWRTAMRGSPVLLRALELLLVPWTLLLAIAPTSPWFPSRAVQWAWVFFDIFLLLLLRAFRRASIRHGTAARRRARATSWWLAVAVSVDALFTMTQAIVWNAPRTAGVGEWLVIALACVGPWLAAPVLWGAWRRWTVLTASR